MKTVPKKAQGFQKIAKNLERIFAENGDPCSCRMCGNIGDAVIALDCPRDMQLEHTDYSFDFLCPPIKQLHKLRPSDLKLNRDALEAAEKDEQDAISGALRAAVH